MLKPKRGATLEGSGPGRVGRASLGLQAPISPLGIVQGIHRLPISYRSYGAMSGYEYGIIHLKYAPTGCW